MNLTLNCIPCIINGFLREANNLPVSEEKKENVLRYLLSLLSQMDYSQSPPALGRVLQRMLRQELNYNDPYMKQKTQYNRLMLEKYPDFKEMLDKSLTPFETALKLAIAGNVIDYGPNHKIDVMATIRNVLNTGLSIDDSHKLKQDLEHAKTVLYIGDNCGEIVFDKLFLETIHHRNVYFVVRGGNVLNDATMEDARLVNLDKVVTSVITTGDDAPGVVWETSSDEFKRMFNKADVIISKGQGNLEGLLGLPHNIYFLLIAKCNVIADKIGVHVGDFIAMRNRNFGKSTMHTEFMVESGNGKLSLNT